MISLLNTTDYSGIFIGVNVVVNTVPDQFYFTDQDDVGLNSPTISNAITIEGVTAGYDIEATVTGGEYRYDDGTGYSAWLTAPSNVQLGYDIQLRVTSSGDYDTSVSATLDVGGTSDDFVVTTAQFPTILVTDYTSIDYNSYVTLAENDQIIQELSVFTPADDYNALTNEQKEYLIKASCQDVNYFQFKGTLNKLVISQYSMQFPRTGLYYPNGVEIASNVIPYFIKQYVAQRCLERLSFGPADANGITIPNNVKRQKADVLEREFFSPKEMTANTLSIKDFHSYNLLKPYVIRTGNVINLVRA